MAAGCWSVSQVASLINRYYALPAQTMVDGKALVSTFEGADWAHNWLSVRDETPDICLVPNWSSLGPHGVAQNLDLIDGACKSTYCCFAVPVTTKLRRAKFPGMRGPNLGNPR